MNQDSSNSSSSSSISDASSVDFPSSPEYSSLTASSDESVDTDHQSAIEANSFPSFKIIGDNLDKTIRPRDMRHDHQTKSLHYFHMYAVRDRVNLRAASNAASLPDASVNLVAILPTRSDEERLRQNFAILIARVIKKLMQFFKTFGRGLEKHILHDEYTAMSQKSEVVNFAIYNQRTLHSIIFCCYIYQHFLSLLFKVPLGVLLKSEMCYEDMVGIMDHTHQYVPTLTKEYVYHDASTDSDVKVPIDDFHHILMGKVYNYEDRSVTVISTLIVNFTSLVIIIM